MVPDGVEDEVVALLTLGETREIDPGAETDPETLSRDQVPRSFRGHYGMVAFA